MQFAQRIGPSHLDEPCERSARRRLKQRVFDKGFHRVNVKVRRYHVVVATQDDGDVLVEEAGSVIEQPIEPRIRMGSTPRARIATPFQERSPRQTAP
jgi:hypothetical protein